jgi:hypothetical protein
MTYTLDYVCAHNHFDCFEEGTLALEYLKMEVSTDILTIGSKECEPITLHNWMAYEPYEEDLVTIKRLMANLDFPPLIVDSTFFVVDGRHRLAALNILGVSTTSIYYPILEVTNDTHSPSNKKRLQISISMV